MRYISTAASTVARRSAAPKSRSRAATSMLAASRLTSHSNGPRSVSSKSFTSNTSDRSGDAKNAEVQEVRVSAQLGVETRYGRRGEIVGHHRRRAAEEREGRREHAAVADRDELGNARRRLSLQDPERIALWRELVAARDFAAAPPPGVHDPLRLDPSQTSSRQPTTAELARDVAARGLPQAPSELAFRRFDHPSSAGYRRSASWPSAAVFATGGASYAAAVLVVVTWRLLSFNQGKRVAV